MPAVQPGDTVRIHYTGRLGDGTVFDSSEGREPLAFTVGSGEVIPGFEQSVTGMEVGETKTIEIPAAEAYGPRREEMTLTLDKDQLPEGMDPAIGQPLQLGLTDGQTVQVVVAAVAEETVTLDANHPLAGKDLIFDLELVDIA